MHFLILIFSLGKLVLRSYDSQTAPALATSVPNHNAMRKETLDSRVTRQIQGLRLP